MLKDVLIGAAVVFMACRILYELKTGESHLRWGPPSKRDEHPSAFWTNIVIQILAIRWRRPCTQIGRIRLQ